MSPATSHLLSLAIAAALAFSAGCSAPDATKPTSQQSAVATENRQTPAVATQDEGNATRLQDAKGQASDASVVSADSKTLLKTRDDRAASGLARQKPATTAALEAEPSPPPPSSRSESDKTAAMPLDSITVAGSRLRNEPAKELQKANAYAAMIAPTPAQAYQPISTGDMMPAAQSVNTENYAKHGDNPVQITADSPVSTFSIDVDTGSYANVRRMLNSGQRPPADAIRAEELLNYFDYAYPMPESRKVPFRVTTEIAAVPWNTKHQLLQIGIQGYDVSKAMLPPSNLVFLIDTSGSMDEPDKLPLLKQAFGQLVNQLRAQDRVTIVVYAGSAGLVLPPTPGDQHARILGALDQLQAGGSTNGGQGIELAYAMAKQSFIKGGSNRVLLATDGDFNVGTANVEALKTMVADQRKSGVALSTLGFGSGNYNDEMAEQLADIGDGNHAYIDSANEARKVLVQQMGATLLTIAKDVKIQVEFNPATVAEYRLIGYEDRALRREDFNNDKIDAGEIGAGHNVTALYELTLVGSGGESSDPLRYAKSLLGADKSHELGLLKLRYKQPNETASQLIQTPLTRSMIGATASPRLRFAAAVAAYADLLRGGSHMGNFGWNDVAKLANGTGGVDRFGYRAEFVQLIAKARAVTGNANGAPVATVAE